MEHAIYTWHDIPGMENALAQSGRYDAGGQRSALCY